MPCCGQSGTTQNSQYTQHENMSLSMLQIEVTVGKEHIKDISRLKGYLNAYKFAINKIEHEPRSIMFIGLSAKLDTGIDLYVGYLNFQKAIDVDPDLLRDAESTDFGNLFFWCDKK
jgi:hypothetical protein